MPISVRMGLLAGCAALLSAGIVRATPIDYIFTGSGAGNLNGVSFDGDFTVTLTGDTDTVDMSGGALLSNVASNATFEFDALIATLTGDANRVVLNTDPAFPSIAFDQNQPPPIDDVGEGLLNTAFESYDLTTALPFTPAASLSVEPATYLTSAGDLTFDNISLLNFAAVIDPVPEPASWTLMLASLALLRYRTHCRRAVAG